MCKALMKLFIYFLFIDVYSDTGFLNLMATVNRYFLVQSIQKKNVDFFELQMVIPVHLKKINSLLPEKFELRDKQYSN